MTAFEKFWESRASLYSASSSYKVLAKEAFEAGQKSVWDYINNDITEKNKPVKNLEK